MSPYHSHAVQDVGEGHPTSQVLGGGTGRGGGEGLQLGRTKGGVTAWPPLKQLPWTCSELRTDNSCPAPPPPYTNASLADRGAPKPAQAPQSTAGGQAPPFYPQQHSPRHRVDPIGLPPINHISWGQRAPGGSLGAGGGGSQGLSRYPRRITGPRGGGCVGGVSQGARDAREGHQAAGRAWGHSGGTGDLAGRSHGRGGVRGGHTGPARSRGVRGGPGPPLPR